MSPRWVIVAGEPEHIASMQEIERDAGRRFRAIGLDAIADAPPLPRDELARHVAAGMAWVATRPSSATSAGEPVGYLVASLVDGHPHIDQVSVVVAAAGHGIGRSLVEGLHHWATTRGHREVTLTTFVDVAFNAPWYQRIGYRPLAIHELGPELAAIVDGEREAGLAVRPRVAMSIELPATST